MKQQIDRIKDWLKKQIQNKTFRRMLTAAVICGLLLSAEFCLMGYGVLKMIRYLILLAGLFVIAWIDQRQKRIPNQILIVLAAGRLGILVAESLVYTGYGLSLFIAAALGALAGGGMFLLAYVLSRGGIGMGDVKLFAVLGFYLGTGSIFTVVFLTVVLSAAYSIVMLIRRKIKLKEEIPFAPFVLAGTLLAMALGS